MKRINIQNYSKPDRESVYTRNHYYCVFLHENKRFYFKNEVKAKHFIAETNRFYNSVLHEYNYIYSQLLVEYRNIWFYVDERFTNVIGLDISNIEKQFNLVISSSRFFDIGNLLTFQ